MNAQKRGLLYVNFMNLREIIWARSIWEFYSSTLTRRKKKKKNTKPGQAQKKRDPFNSLKSFLPLEQISSPNLITIPSKLVSSEVQGQKETLHGTLQRRETVQALCSLIHPLYERHQYAAMDEDEQRALMSTKTAGLTNIRDDQDNKFTVKLNCWA